MQREEVGGGLIVVARFIELTLSVKFISLLHPTKAAILT